jgi:hypothetical protein
MKDNLAKWISGLGVFMALWLIWKDLQTGNACPHFPFISVPACYFVLGFFLLVFVSRFVKNEKMRFALATLGGVAGLTTAVWFSINQIIGLQHCPRLFNIPLCFISFVVFLLLLILVSGTPDARDDQSKRQPYA